MHPPPPIAPKRGQYRMNARNANVESAWIISADPALVDRIQALLLSLTGDVRVIDAQEFSRESFWSPRPATPELIILDIGQRLQWGSAAIQRLKQIRINAPIVVITRDFSNEFGARILSEGVKYYLAHDFCFQELYDLAESLLRRPPNRGAVTSDSTGPQS